MTAEKMLALLLRVGGVVMLFAVGAAVMPGEWMAQVHKWLGMGELPRDRIVEYLARSVSLLYALHGALLLIISRDIRRYRPLVLAVAWLTGIFGAAILAIDVSIGMPPWWSGGEGACVIGIGVAMWALARRVPA